jgi:hypothetical protein
MQVRDRRPHQELTGDAVQQQLLTQADLLTNCMHKLTKGAAAIAVAVRRLKDVRLQLRDDAADKVCICLYSRLRFFSPWPCGPSTCQSSSEREMRSSLYTSQQSTLRQRTRPTDACLKEAAILIDQKALAATAEDAGTVPGNVQRGALTYPRAWTRSSAERIAAADALVVDAQVSSCELTFPHI